jgi:site-specific DNA-methyltransferase (adenine-specific)
MTMVSQEARVVSPNGNSTGLKPYFDEDGLSIFHGDCRAVLPTLASASVDLVLTDPAYLVNFTGRFDAKHEAIAGDDDTGWVVPVFTELWRVLKDDSFAVTFYGWPHADVFVGAFKEVGFRLVSHLVFLKRVWGLGRFTRGQHEVAYLLAKGRPAVPKRGISDVIDWEREPNAGHPNQKPVAALMPLLLTYAERGQTVLDPFMGSGSTLLAARQCGNPAIGIEIERDYCAFAARRMEQKDLFPAGWARDSARLAPEDAAPELFLNQ